MDLTQFTIGTWGTKKVKNSHFLSEFNLQPKPKKKYKKTVMLTKEYLLKIKYAQVNDIDLAIEHFTNKDPITFRNINPSSLADDREKALLLYQTIKEKVGEAPCVYFFNFSRGYQLTPGEIILQEEVNKEKGTLTPKIRADKDKAKAIYIGSSLNMGKRAINHLIEHGVNTGRGKVKKISIGAQHTGTCLRMNRWVKGLVDLHILPMPGAGKIGINFIEEILKEQYGTMFGRKEN